MSKFEFFIIPLIIGLAVWGIAQAVLKKKSLVLLIVCIIASIAGSVLGTALVYDPSSAAMLPYAELYARVVRMLAAAVIGSAIAAAMAAYIYSLIVRPPRAGS